MSLISLTDAKKTGLKDRKVDLIVIISPCSDSHYSDAKKLGDSLNVPIIALNSPYSYKYDIGGGSPFDLTYVMKRIPKGWVYRQYPSDYECIIEGPDYEIFRAKSFKTRPRLTEIAADSMKASEEKYGKAGNDRIFQQRL